MNTKKILNFEKICYLFIEIDSFLKKYGNLSIRNQHLLVKDTIDLLKSSEDEKIKTDLLIRNYKSLFCGRAGLTEFYVWDNDYEKRCIINKPFVTATDKLWEIMKPYI